VPYVPLIQLTDVPLIELAVPFILIELSTDVELSTAAMPATPTAPLTGQTSTTAIGFLLTYGTRMAMMCLPVES
jgi:hypothetical protein